MCTLSAAWCLLSHMAKGNFHALHHDLTSSNTFLTHCLYTPPQWTGSAWMYND